MPEHRPNGSRLQRTATGATPLWIVAVIHGRRNPRVVWLCLEIRPGVAARPADAYGPRKVPLGPTVLPQRLQEQAKHPIELSAVTTSEALGITGCADRVIHCRDVATFAD